MRFNMDFSAEENGLLLDAVHNWQKFHNYNPEANIFTQYAKAGIDIGQTFETLKGKANFMVNLQNEETLQAAVQQLAQQETPSV